jgi:hypothetical protein
MKSTNGGSRKSAMLAAGLIAHLIGWSMPAIAQEYPARTKRNCGTMLLA